MPKKRLVVCCDGTWNDLRMRYITNVGRLLQCLLPVDEGGDTPIPQVAYYDDGVGADAEGFRRVIEGGIGKGLDNLVYEAYRFVCFNYQPGDELYFFGYSRGAYTARSVVGMLGTVGLVPRARLGQIPRAMEVYRQHRDAVQAQREFRAQVGSEVVNVDFLGCWDTVGALGIPDKTALFTLDRVSRARYEFHDTRLGPHVQRAAHAVAIDERRKEFSPTLMRCARGVPKSRLREVWFPGDHGCVGGGSWEKRGLSNAALCWMIETAVDMGAPLAVDLDRLHDRARADHTVFFAPAGGWIYTDEARPLSRLGVSWQSLHPSVSRRWRDEPSYRPRNLLAAHGKRLKAQESPAPAAAEQSVPRALAAGQSHRVRVSASEAGTDTGVQLIAGQRYLIRVSPLQVWQDGRLDPCDARGWNTVQEGADRESKLPWKDGRQVQPALLKGLVRPSKHRALVPEADWFELVAAIGDGEYRRLQLPPPITPDADIETVLTAWTDGELRLAANDIAHRWQWLDRYGNNRGWIWVEVAAHAGQGSPPVADRPSSRRRKKLI